MRIEPPVKHSARLRRSGLRFCGAALLLLSFVPGVSWAQDPRFATVTGEVRDGVTNAPVVGAVIAIPDLNLSTLTDSAGSFVLSEVPEGTYSWTVVGLGYVPLNQEALVKDGDHFTIGLLPRPLELEEIVVNSSLVNEILIHRRRASGVSSRLLTRKDLARSGVPRAERLIQERARVITCPITGMRPNPSAAMMAASAVDNAGGMRQCVRYRGKTTPVALFINDQYALGGLVQLETYFTSELYAVEMRRGGAEIRVFTNDFIKRVSQGRARLSRLPPMR